MSDETNNGTPVLESVLYKGHEINYHPGQPEYAVDSLKLEGTAAEDVHPLVAAQHAIDAELHKQATEGKLAV